MLLLITGSIDGTSDLLVSHLEKDIFRFNYDLYKDYHLKFTPNYWELTNPTGHSINSNTVTSAFWWKAFNYYLLNEEKFIEEEVKYIFREIYHWCRLRGLCKGVSHDFHNHMGKINILNIASRYFSIPETLISFKLSGIKDIKSHGNVAKSLTSGLTTTNKALFTTKVNLEALHPDYPWFIQELIDSKADVTIFICGKKLFAYERDRSNLKGLDWRSEQTFDTNKKEWNRFLLTTKEENSIQSFCKDIKVDWGRMDFMRKNKELVFLEYNANGQWVFLDYSEEDKLVSEVCSYLIS